MSQQPPTATEPDLMAGIPGDTLADGVRLLGRVDGETAILVRRGEDVFAIGATCAHWGGPLPEGLVVDETVRCPWHHAELRQLGFDGAITLIDPGGRVAAVATVIRNRESLEAERPLEQQAPGEMAPDAR